MKRQISILTYGAYLSRTLDHVEGRGTNRVVTYHFVFENLPDVTVRVYFGINDPDHLITGFGWDD